MFVFPKPFPCRIAAAAVAAACLGSVDPAGATELLFVNPQNSNWTTVPSAIWSSPPADREAADDFDLHATIERVIFVGDNPCLVQCDPPPVTGVVVRFHEWTEAGPGAVQQESWLSPGDPGLIYDPDGPDGIDVTLPTPFVASGRHYVSMQVAFEGSFHWEMWISNFNEPVGAPLSHRDGSGGWGPYIDILGDPVHADLAFQLYGTPADPAPPELVRGCAEWVPFETPNPDGAEHAILRDVHVIGPDDVWAVGEYNKLVQGQTDTFTMVMRWDGAEWSLVPSPSPTACGVCTYATLDAVAAVSPDEVWAAGSARLQAPDGFLGTHILVMRWNGDDWEVMDTPFADGGSGEQIRDIEVIAPDDVWLVGDWVNPQVGLGLHWDGSDFELRLVPIIDGASFGTALEGVSALATDDVWAVGGGGDGDYSDVSVIFHWDGSGWTHVPGPTPGLHRLYGVHMFATDDVWAWGEYVVPGVGFLPLMLHWDGTGWTQVDSPSGGGGFAPFGPDDILAIGSGVAHWDGTEWTPAPTIEGVPGAAVGTMAVVDECEAWGVGRKLVGGDLLSFAVRLQPIAARPVPGDVDGDGVVDFDDVIATLAAWGPCGDPCPADLGGNGVVGFDDLLAVLAAFDVAGG